MPVKVKNCRYAYRLIIMFFLLMVQKEMRIGKKLCKVLNVKKLTWVRERLMEYRYL